MIESLVTSQKTDLLPIAYLLASLVFQKKDEREWLDWRFAMYQDILRESWVYQGILREGLEEGREQGLEEGRAEGLQVLRQTLVSFIEMRFPALVPLTQQQTAGIKDPGMLQNITIKMFSMQTSSEAEQFLLTLGDDAKKD